LLTVERLDDCGDRDRQGHEDDEPVSFHVFSRFRVFVASL
jgi:hypothetical protein